MVIVGVYGLLRIGELCYIKDGDVIKFIRNKDVNIESKAITITLHQTKTDSKKVGVRKKFP